VDTFERYNPRGGEKNILNFVRFAVQMRRTTRPDVCLVADRSFRSAVLAVLCGAKVRAGYDSEGRGKLLTHPIRYNPDRSEIECHLDILRALAPDNSDPYDSCARLVPDPGGEDARPRILEEREAMGPLLLAFSPARTTTKSNGTQAASPLSRTL
jgi:ADP-heptose:LPS heptosyltransferase